MYSSKTCPFPKRVRASSNDLLNFFLETGTEQQINFVFELEDKVDQKIMKQAVRMTMDAEHILGSRLIQTRRRAYWERHDNLDILDYFHFQKSNSIERDVRDFILSSLDPCNDSIIKIGLFRAQKDVLVIKTHHCAMDAGGYYDFFDLLSETYNHLLDDPDYKVTPTLGTSRELRQVLKHFSFYTKMRSLMLERGYKPKWAFPSISTNNTKKTYTIRSIDAERFQRIKQYGKEQQATLNDMFITAYYRALFKITKPSNNKTKTVAIPTDLRALIPGSKAETITNLVAATFVNLKYNPEESFDDMLLEVNKQMNRKKDIHLGLGITYVLNNLFKIRYRWIAWAVRKLYRRMYKGGKMHPILSNIGRIDNKERKFGSVKIKDAYLVPPYNWAPNFATIISSFNKKITFSIGYYEDSYESRTIEHFLDLVLTEFPD